MIKIIIKETIHREVTVDTTNQKEFCDKVALFELIRSSTAEDVLKTYEDSKVLSKKQEVITTRFEEEL